MIEQLFSEQGVLIFFVFFVIFIFIAFKTVKFLFKALIIGIVAATFPIVGNLVLGLDIDISIFNIIWFAGTGVGLYFVYNVLRGGWKFLKTVTAPLRWARKGSSKKKKEKD